MGNITESPQLDRVGHRVYKTMLPHLPDEVVDSGRMPVDANLFAPHPEAEKLAKIYATRLATKEMFDPETGERIEIGLARKNHPYLGRTPYDAMVQFFGRRPVRTLAEWRDNQFEIGQEYLHMVASTTEAMISLIDDPALYVVATNCAPFSKYGAPLNVQSVSAPHTHVIAITEAEVEGWQTMSQFQSSVERRKYAGLNSRFSQLYRRIVWELLPDYAIDEHGDSLNNIGAEAFSPLRLNETPVSLHEDSEEFMPPGFTFTMKDGISSIRNPDFLNRIITFDAALSRIYMDLAAVFVANYYNIPDIGSTAEQSVPLWLRAKNSLLMQHAAFVDRQNGNGHQRLSDYSVRELERIVGKMAQKPQSEAKQLLGNVVTRGPAYSLIFTPESLSDPNGPWRVSIPLWIFGGGGVEGIGIEKDRVTPDRPEHPELLAQYNLIAQQRTDFETALIERLVSMDPLINDCLPRLS